MTSQREDTAQWTPTLTRCDHCNAQVFRANRPEDDRTNPGTSVLWDAQEHELAIYVTDRPGWMRKLTTAELMEAGRLHLNLHAHHQHPQPCDRPPAPTPALF